MRAQLSASWRKETQIAIELFAPNGLTLSAFPSPVVYSKAQPNSVPEGIAKRQVTHCTATTACSTSGCCNIAISLIVACYRAGAFVFFVVRRTTFAFVPRMMSIAFTTSAHEICSSASTYTTQSGRSLSSFLNALASSPHKTGLEFKYRRGGTSAPASSIRTSAGIAE